MSKFRAGKFGTIATEGGNWVVRTQPHVATRLRRLFQQSKRGRDGELILSATPAHAYELAWVLERYPMDVLCPAAFKDALKAHHDRMEAVHDVLHNPDYAPPLFQLAHPARDYQRVAADMLLRSGHLLLGDDLGIGKTISAICALTERNALPALVVAMTHLQRQWRSELAKFAPGLATHIVRKGTPYDLTRGRRGKKEPFPDVIIITYHKLSGWADELAGVVRTVVFDEVQDLRRHESQKYRAAAHIAHSAHYAMGLSATPIYNYGSEIHNVVDVLAPDHLGTREEFLQEWCKGGGDRKEKAMVVEPEALGTYLREQGIMLRRTRADVGRELPELTKIPHHIDADLAELDRVSRHVAELAEIILTRNDAKNFDKMRAASELDVKLRYATGVAKAPYVAEFVKMIIESGEKVVLYGWHHDVYEIWRDRLADYEPAMYTGRESESQKDHSKHRFIEGDTPLLIMSLRSGAGLDGLQGVVRTGVFGELDWSPKVHDQCIGRYHRDGQGDPCAAYYLISDAGTDPLMADILGVKQSQIEGIVNPGQDLFEHTGDADHVKKLARSVLDKYRPKMRKAG